MFVSLKANKKRILAFVILVVVVIAACLLLNMKKSEDVPVQEYYGGTNEERVSFLASFGWEVSGDAVETREVMIPESFNDVYTTYNDMQKAQGFDLKPYAGFICMQYKYQITNYPDEREIFATLLVYNDLILGGDVACAEVDGFMHGFAADSARYDEDSVSSAGNNTEASASSESAENDTANTENANNSAATVEENQADTENNTTTEESVANTEEAATDDVYPTD